jgi:aquaporin PIP
VCAEFCATMIFVALGVASVIFTSDAATMPGVLLTVNGTVSVVPPLGVAGYGPLAIPIPASASTTLAGLAAAMGAPDPAAAAAGGSPRMTEAASSTIAAVLNISFGLPRWLNIAFCFGLMIGVLIFSTGSISGGNLNPAVTISLAITQKMSTFRATCYVVAQCAGSVLGAGIVRSMASNLFMAAGGATNFINTQRFRDPVTGNPLIGTWTAVGGEMLGTALLVFTVCAAADVGREKNNKYQGALTPFIIGLAVLVSHLFLIPITGCSINPARTFGTAVIYGEFRDHWVFWMGPLLGGIIAALLYENLFRLYGPGGAAAGNGGNGGGSGKGGAAEGSAAVVALDEDAPAPTAAEVAAAMAPTRPGAGASTADRGARIMNQMRLAGGGAPGAPGAGGGTLPGEVDLADAYAASDGGGAGGGSSGGRLSEWR